MSNLFMGIIALLVVIIPFSLSNRHGRFRFSNPLFILSMSLLIGTGLKTVGLFWAPELSFYNVYNPTLANPLKGYIFTFIFVCLMCLGYLVSVKRTRRIDDPVYALQYSPLILPDFRVVMVLIASVSVFLVTAFFYTRAHSSGVSLPGLFTFEGLKTISRYKVDYIEGNTEFGNTYGHIRIFFVSLIFSLLILFTQLYVRRKSAILLGSIAILIVLNFMVAIMLGKRTDLVMIILLLVLIHFCYRPQVRAKLFVYGFITLAAILVIFGVMTQARVNQGVDDVITLNIIDPIINQVIFSTYFFDINIISLVIENIKEDEFLYGKSYTDWATSFVPRILWPDKPPTSYGQYVTKVIMDRPGGLGGWVATITGEAYMNFAWFGVFIGGAFGMLFRKIEEFFTSTKALAYFGGPWFYIYFLYQWCWHLPQTSFATFFAGFLYSTILAAFVLFGFRWIAARPQVIDYRAVQPQLI